MFHAKDKMRLIFALCHEKRERSSTVKVLLYSISPPNICLFGFEMEKTGFSLKWNICSTVLKSGAVLILHMPVLFSCILQNTQLYFFTLIVNLLLAEQG